MNNNTSLSASREQSDQTGASSLHKFGACCSEKCTNLVTLPHKARFISTTTSPRGEKGKIVINGLMQRERERRIQISGGKTWNWKRERGGVAAQRGQFFKSPYLNSSQDLARIQTLNSGFPPFNLSLSVCSTCLPLGCHGRQDVVLEVISFFQCLRLKMEIRVLRTQKDYYAIVLWYLLLCVLVPVVSQFTSIYLT